ncbi:hypothetical protein JVU11DRAFT_272 [Chiua virens]|nr:hypothetical protein JVU11DRAFT_272 [Chiua virens]
MNKLLPPLPRQDDLAGILNALSLADEGAVHLPPRVENLDGLSLADEQPADLPPWIETFKGLSLADKEPTQAKLTILPLPQRRRNLVENRNARSVAGKKPEKKISDFLVSHQTTFKFIGGFDPRLVNAEVDDYRLPLQVVPRQPIVNRNDRPTAPRPSKATAVPSIQIETPIPMPVPEGTPTKPVFAPPAVVIVPPRQRLDSIPSAAKNVTLDGQPTVNRDTPINSSRAPPSSPGKVRCSGTTRAGKQCGNSIRLPATHIHPGPTPAIYCHLHIKEAKPTARIGVHARDDEDLDRLFNDCIPKYLQKHTQEALKKEMTRKLSVSDGPGYIYVFEIRDPERPDVIQLKVGRTVKLNKRLDEWGKQCGSKDQILRGWWPGTIEDGNGTDVILLKGNIKPGDFGPFCHRLERLVHLELSDLSSYEPYNGHPDWPNGMSKLSSLTGAGARPSRRPIAYERCSDCSKVHKEIFTFRRPQGREYDGRDWNLIVKPVIKRWGRFVKEYYT